MARFLFVVPPMTGHTNPTLAVAAEEARKEALQQLNEQKSDLDYSRATAELAEAVAQLRTLDQLRQKGGRR